MSEKDYGARLRDPKCRCGWLKRVLPSGIMVCFLCDQVHLIPNAQPNIAGLRPSSPPPFRPTGIVNEEGIVIEPPSSTDG